MSIDPQISLEIPSKKISELSPSLPEPESVIPVSDNNTTKKVKLKDVVKLPHQHTAQDVTLDYEGYATVRQALEQLLYKEPKVEIYNNIGTVQYGTVVNSLTVTWNLTQGQISTQSLTDAGSIGSFLRSYTYNNANIIDNKIITLQYSDGITQKNATTEVSFRHKRYWGLSTLSMLTDQHIRVLNSEFATNRQQIRTFSPNQQYVYFAFPSYFGQAGFKFNGLTNSAWEVTNRDFVNSSGYTENYLIYRSTFFQSGFNISLEVI
jgi:hypothetical protein